MWHFRVIEKKTIKNDCQSFWILFLQNLSWVILVWTFCSICMVQLFCLDFELSKYYKIIQIQNGRFKSVCSQRLIGSLIDIAVQICQIKKNLLETFPWNVLTSISLLVALVIKGLIIWESKCHQKMPWCYLMAMWSMRKQKFIDQLSCNISEIMRKSRPFWIL